MNQEEKPTEYHDVILTDIKLHTVKARKPVSWYRAIWRSFKKNLPGRFYSSNIQIKKDGAFKFGFPLSPNLQREKEIAEKAGKKFRIFMHKGGVPVYFGPDAIEHIKAQKKKENNKTRVWHSEKNR